MKPAALSSKVPSIIILQSSKQKQANKQTSKTNNTLNIHREIRQHVVLPFEGKKKKQKKETFTPLAVPAWERGWNGARWEGIMPSVARPFSLLSSRLLFSCRSTKLNHCTDPEMSGHDRVWEAGRAAEASRGVLGRRQVSVASGAGKEGQKFGPSGNPFPPTCLLFLL